MHYHDSESRILTALTPHALFRSISIYPEFDEYLVKLPRSAQFWAPGLLRDRLRRRLQPEQPPRRLHVALTDHYEPLGGGVPLSRALDRVATWQRLWPALAHAAPRDARGQTPQYGFFYPQEEYHPEILSSIAEITRTGTGEVEVHIHHDHDTAESLRTKLSLFLRQLYEGHGLLHLRDGQPIFGFIHGNWALDNSRPDGRWCGVTGELPLLRSLGCYADFTMPSVPAATQGGPVNQIFWSAGPNNRPKSFSHGIPARPGAGRQGELLLVPGPLGLRRGARWFAPRMETGELAFYDPPSPTRIPGWLSLAPQLGGDLFLTLYTHGAREDNAAVLLGTGANPGLLPTFHALAEVCQQRGLELFWSTPFQIFERIERILSPAAPLTPEPQFPNPLATSAPEGTPALSTAGALLP